MKIKGIISAITVLFVATATPSQAQTGPALGVSDYRVNRPQPHICTRDASGKLNIRTGPSTYERAITQIPNGMPVYLHYGDYAADGFWWWNVTSNRVRGWVRSDYVCNDPQ
ncbi:MAG: SH3 domain-containing protein [Cyanobacteria bacterium]|nr:SH3 domain-containing protein [Cyanobacteria bacterium GSL.Bin21]